jgi:hypothetical protein
VCLQDEAGLLMQLDAIQGTGTIIIISNLRRNSAHQLELDFDADASDIRIAADPPEEGSVSPAPNYQQSRATQPKEVWLHCQSSLCCVLGLPLCATCLSLQKQILFAQLLLACCLQTSLSLHW